eukprot:3582565-Pyramimonas_sp.AAC.1
MSDVDAQNMRSREISVKQLLEVVLKVFLFLLSREQMEHVYIVLGNGELRGTMKGRRRVLA